MAEMRTMPFELQPFPGSHAPAIQITGTAARSNEQLILCYDVTGTIADLLIPSSNANPERVWELWETTCFEAFIGTPDRPNYWEVNLSPNGNWNLFALQDYREGLEIEQRVEQLEIKTEQTVDRFQLTAKVPLGATDLADLPILLGVTTVIQTQESAISYWAIAHCGSEADFHLRESFKLTL